MVGHLNGGSGNDTGDKMALRQIMWISYYLESEGVPRPVALYAEKFLKGWAMTKDIKIDHDFTHMKMIFRPVGGQDKRDVFIGK